MRFVCDSCRAQYMISDDKVGPKGVKVRCKKCSHTILVRKTQDAPVAAPPGAGYDDEERDQTQVMSNPLASLGASINEELTNPGGAPAPKPAEKPIDPDNLLGASEDEIGAVFDSVLNSGNHRMPGTEDQKDDEQTQIGGGGPSAGALGDDDDRMSTRVIDADTVRKLAAETSAGGAPAESGNGEAKEKEKKDAEHEWYVAIDEKQVGPLKADAVKEKWDNGEIGPDSLCWRAGFSDWIPLSDADELASVLAPKPKNPLIVSNAPAQQQPAVVSVPVESAFSSGGMTRTVRSEVQVPMGAAAVPDEPGAWKPSAASALASLVKEEIDAMDKPPPPAPSPASSGEGAMALGGGLLDLPGDEPRPSRPAASPLFDAPAPSPAPAPHQPMNAGYAPAPAPMPMQQAPQQYAPQPYNPYAMPPPPAANNNKLLMIVGGAVVALLLVVVVVLVLTRTPAAPVQQPQLAMVQEQPPPPPVRQEPVKVAPPVEQPKVEEKKVEEKKEEAAPPPAEAVAEKKAEEPPPKVEEKKEEAPRERVVQRRTSRGDDDNLRAAVSPPPPKVEERPSKPPPEPKGTDDEFDSMFGGGGSKKAEAPPEPPKKKSGGGGVYIPPAPGSADSNVPEKLGNSDIIQVVTANVPAIKKCVSEQKAKDPSASGRIVMRWTIQTSGRVTNVNCRSDEYKSAYIAGCLGGVIKGMSFPKHRTQGPPVDFPFTF